MGIFNYKGKKKDSKMSKLQKELDKDQKERFDSLNKSFQYIEKCLALDYLRKLDINILTKANLNYVKNSQIDFEKILFNTSMEELMQFGLRVAEEEAKVKPITLDKNGN